MFSCGRVGLKTMRLSKCIDWLSQHQPGTIFISWCELSLHFAMTVFIPSSFHLPFFLKSRSGKFERRKTKRFPTTLTQVKRYMDGLVWFMLFSMGCAGFPLTLWHTSNQTHAYTFISLPLCSFVFI